MTTVNVHEAKTQLSRLLEEVRAGKDVVIARAGRPIARLIPIEDEAPRRPGLAKGRVTNAFFEPLDPDELAAWDQ